MKRFLMTIALTCVLSGTALAGLIPSDGVTAPPPDETTVPTAPGDIPSVPFTQQISETALNLLQLVLSAVV
jgi:hypothetical protein